MRIGIISLRKRVFLAFALCVVVPFSFLIISVQAPLPTPLRWNIATLDSDEYAGWNTAIALDSSGGPHISYYNWMNGVLKYARWTDTFNLWDLETVDSTVGFADLGVHYLALDSLGDPHMGYYNTYSRKSGGTWSKQYFADGGRHTSLALDSSDKPHISYGGGYDLKYAMWTSSAWSVETVDLAATSPYTCIALDSINNPHISYRGVDGGLKYARKIGNAWSIETVDSTPDGIGWAFTSLALDSGDNPHISYKGSHGLRYARRSGGAWSLATVDSSSDLAIWNSIDVDSGNNPHISYSDESNARLRYARMIGDEWSIETVDAGTAGQGNSLALDSSDNPHISYYGGRTVGLKYASILLPNTIWSSDYLGNPKDVFVPGEPVFVTAPCPRTYWTCTVMLYVVTDKTTWNDGDSLTDVSGGPDPASWDPGPLGTTHTAGVWAPPLTVGNYDIVMDKDNDGVFDAGLDLVDSVLITGFNVVPEVPLGTVMTLLSMITALAGFLGFKRIRPKLQPQ